MNERFPHDNNPYDNSDPTRPLPPYQAPTGQPGYQPGYPVGPQVGQQAGPPPPPPFRRARGATAAVLVSALVLGGAAGVGGAAAYSAFTDNGSGISTDSSGSFEATKTAAIKDGTVEKVANAVLPSVVKVNVSGQQGSGTGSGIVLSKDGEVLTNNHVVAGAGEGSSLSVSFNDGTTKKANVVGTDPLTDIAVIKVEDVDDLTPASLGKSDELKVAQAVVAASASM